MATVLDKLVTILGFEVDKTGAKKYQKTLNNIAERSERQSRRIAAASSAITAGDYSIIF